MFSLFRTENEHDIHIELDKVFNEYVSKYNPTTSEFDLITVKQHLHEHAIKKFSKTSSSELMTLVDNFVNSHTSFDR